MRAREPDEQGYVDRDGVKVAYETFGWAADDRPTVVFVPIDTIIHSRAWKAQVPYLAQHYRRGHHRPERQRTLGSTDRPGGLRRPGVRGRHDRGDGPDSVWHEPCWWASA